MRVEGGGEEGGRKGGFVETVIFTWLPAEKDKTSKQIHEASAG